MVQLDSKDCLWKLGEDLLQLFVYRPTCDLTHPVSSLAHLYQECFSRKLVTAVYSAKDLEQVLKSKVLKTVINVSILSDGFDDRITASGVFSGWVPPLCHVYPHLKLSKYKIS